MTNSGYIKRLPIEEFEAQSRGGKVRSTVISFGDALQCDAELCIDPAYPSTIFHFSSAMIFKILSTNMYRESGQSGCPDVYR